MIFFYWFVHRFNENTNSFVIPVVMFTIQILCSLFHEIIKKEKKNPRAQLLLLYSLFHRLSQHLFEPLVVKRGIVDLSDGVEAHFRLIR